MALASSLKRYIRDVQAWRIKGMFTNEPSILCSQWEGNKMKPDPSRGETELYWRGILEKEASYTKIQ